MAAPQGIVTFGGVRAFLGTTFTIGHGIAPNVCQIQIPPQPGLPMEGGTLSFTYGGTRIDFPDCKVDSIQGDINADGFQVWTLNILDRRWKWKFGGQVSGYYNVRVGNGDDIREKTKKKPRELAELCLKAMGETRYDLGRMPNDLYPEIEWEYELPSEALAKLADLVNCRVVLKLNNTVSIEPVGEGQRLHNADALEYSASLDPPERPDVLVFVAGRTLYQADLKLEAIGRDTDGTWKLIDKLTYRPEDGWYQYDPDFAMIVDEKSRELAKQDVFRKYRIKVPFDVPGTGRRIDDLRFILPVLSEQLAKEKVNDEEKRKPAIIWGTFATKKAGAKNNDPEAGTDPEEDDKWVYHGGWSIDRETGIISFSEAVYELAFYKERVDGVVLELSETVPATIKLRTAFGTRDEKTLAWGHHELERKGPGKKFGTKPQFFVHNDIQRGIYTAPSGKLIDNKKEVEDQGKHYLDEAEKQFQISEPQSATFIGLKRIDPDGAIQQVTWSISESGATTRASRNKEELIVTDDYKTRRLSQRLEASLAKAEETSRLKTDRDDRRPS